MTSIDKKNNGRMVDTFGEALRPTEAAKIMCGKPYFAALGCEVIFQETWSFGEFIRRIL